MNIYRIYVFCVICVLVSTGDKTSLNNILSTKILHEVKEPCSESCAKCITNLVHHYLPNGVEIHLLAFTYHDIDNIIKALNNDQHSGLILRSFYNQESFDKPDVYIYFPQSTSDLRLEMKKLQMNASWHPAIKSIFVFLDTTEDEINEIFIALLEFNIYNVICLLKTAADTMNIYTYFPFQNNNCGRKFEKIENFGNCADFKEIQLFPKIFNNYRNCTVVAAARENFPNVIRSSSFIRSHYTNGSNLGIEQYLLNCAAEAAGITLKYIYPSNKQIGTAFENGTATGLLAYLQNSSADIVLGDLSLTLSRVNLFDYMSFFKYDRYLLISSSDYDPRIQHLSVTVWGLIFCVYSLILVITVLFELSQGLSLDWLRSALELYGYLLGQSNNHLFRQNKLKLLLILWIWFSMFIGYCYIAARSSSITLKKNEVPLLSLSNEEYTKIFREPCVDSSTITYLITAYNYTVAKHEMRPECQYKHNALKLVTRTKGMFTIGKQYDEYFFEIKNNIQITSVPLTLPFNQAVMYIKKGFYFGDIIRTHLQYLFESGLQKKYYNKLRTEFKIKKSVKVESGSRHLKQYFVVLLFGYTITCICFIVERIRTVNSTNVSSF